MKLKPALLGAGDRIGLYNHRGGHGFPRDARRLAYRWLDHWLGLTPVRDEIGETAETGWPARVLIQTEPGTTCPLKEPGR